MSVKKPKQNYKTVIPNDVWVIIGSFADVVTLRHILNLSTSIQREIIAFLSKNQNFKPIFDDIFQSEPTEPWIGFKSYETNIPFMIFLNKFFNYGIKFPIEDKYIPWLFKLEEQYPETCRVPLVRLILTDARCVGERFFAVVRNAMTCGTDEYAKVFLDNTTIDLNNSVYYFFQEYNLDRLKLIMNHPRIDINKICTLGDMIVHGKESVKIVKFLLEDGRLDPGANDNSAIYRAVMNCHTEIVVLLLADKRVDPSKANVWNAVRSDITDLIDICLKDGRFDPSVEDHSAFIEAISKGHTHLVTEFLKHPNVDPSSNDNAGLKRALQNKNGEIVQLLVQDPRFKMNKQAVEKLKNSKGLKNKRLKAVKMIHAALQEYLNK
jgi:hypothetical protein